jgi:hypothetical protein
MCVCVCVCEGEGFTNVLMHGLIGRQYQTKEDIYLLLLLFSIPFIIYKNGNYNNRMVSDNLSFKVRRKYRQSFRFQ